MTKAQKLRTLLAIVECAPAASAMTVFESAARRGDLSAFWDHYQEVLGGSTPKGELTVAAVVLSRVVPDASGIVLFVSVRESAAFYPSGLVRSSGMCPSVECRLAEVFERQNRRRRGRPQRRDFSLDWGSVYRGAGGVSREVLKPGMLGVGQPDSA